MQAFEEATGEQKMVDILQKQFVFSDIITPSLYSGIEYDHEGAVRWYPMRKRKTIVLDPTLQFGTPIIASVGIPTDTIYASYVAEGRDKEMVARVFNVTSKLVIDAVEFEERFAA